MVRVAYVSIPSHQLMLNQSRENKEMFDSDNNATMEQEYVVDLMHGAH